MLIYAEKLDNIRIYFRLRLGWEVISSYLLCLGIYWLFRNAIKQFMAQRGRYTLPQPCKITHIKARKQQST